MKDRAPREYTRREVLQNLGKAGIGVVGFGVAEVLAGCSEPPPKKEIDPRPLKENWQIDVQPSNFAIDSLDGSKLYANIAGKITRVDMQTGKEEWHIPQLEKPIFGPNKDRSQRSQILGIHEEILVVHDEVDKGNIGELIGFNTRTQKIAWTIEAGNNQYEKQNLNPAFLRSNGTISLAQEPSYESRLIIPSTVDIRSGKQTIGQTQESSFISLSLPQESVVQRAVAYSEDKVDVWANNSYGKFDLDTFTLTPDKKIDLPGPYGVIEDFKFERPEGSTLLIAGNSEKRKKAHKDGKPPGFYEYYFGAFALFDEKNPQKRIWENDNSDLATEPAITAERFVQYKDNLYVLATRGEDKIQVHAFDLSSGKERWDHTETHRDIVKASDHVLAASVDENFSWIDDEQIVVRYRVDNHEKDKKNNTFDAGLINVRTKDGKVIDTMSLGKHNSVGFDEVASVKGIDSIYITLGNYLCAVKDGKATPIRRFDEAITDLQVVEGDLIVATNKEIFSFTSTK